MIKDISKAKTSHLGLFSKRASRVSVTRQDSTEIDLQGESGGLTTFRPAARQLRFNKNSPVDLLERLLKLASEAFVSSFKELLLEQITLLLEKNKKLLEYVVKNQKLNPLNIDKWKQSTKVLDLVDRLESLGIKIRPEIQPEFQRRFTPKY